MLHIPAHKNSAAPAAQFEVKAPIKHSALTPEPQRFGSNIAHIVTKRLRGAQIPATV